MYRDGQVILLLSLAMLGVHWLAALGAEAVPTRPTVYSVQQLDPFSGGSHQLPPNRRLGLSSKGAAS
jgi:hypothetical protein